MSDAFWVTGGHRYHTADCRVLPSCVTRNEWSREEIASGRQAGENLAFRTPLTPCRICAPEVIEQRRSGPVRLTSEPSRRAASAASLADFLLARIAEDEGRARVPLGDEQNWQNLNPARVLAECEAKRRIVERSVTLSHEQGMDSETCGRAYEYDDYVLPLLALPYAGHADYREEWKL